MPSSTPDKKSSCISDLRPVEFGVRPGQELRSANRRDIGMRHVGRLDPVAPREAGSQFCAGGRQPARYNLTDRARELAGLALDVDDPERARPGGLACQPLAEPGIDDLDPLQRIAGARVAAVEP